MLSLHANLSAEWRFQLIRQDVTSSSASSSGFSVFSFSLSVLAGSRSDDDKLAVVIVAFTYLCFCVPAKSGVTLGFLRRLEERAGGAIMEGIVDARCRTIADLAGNNVCGRDTMFASNFKKANVEYHPLVCQSTTFHVRICIYGLLHCCIYLLFARRHSKGQTCSTVVYYKDIAIMENVFWRLA